MDKSYKALFVVLAALIWLMLGCTFDDIPEQNRQKATILEINGDEIQTDHGRYVAQTEFEKGDTCWIVTDAQGYQCLCTDDDFHTCSDVIAPGGDTVHHRGKK